MTEVLPQADGAISDAVSLPPEEFKSLFRQHAAGVAVITLRHGDRLVGFTATSVISVSAEPAIFAFSINNTSSSWPALERTERVTANLLAADQQAVSNIFATSGIDRFAETEWEQHPSGDPVLPGAAGRISGRILQRIPAGSSHLILVAADSSDVADKEPLVYRNRVYHQLLEYEI